MKRAQKREIARKAIQRFEAGESVAEICRSLGKTRQWFYKWLQQQEKLSSETASDKAYNRIPERIEQAVINIRKKLQKHPYAQTGVNAINQELYKQGINPLPAATINRIIKRSGLVRKPASKPYSSKGKIYPKHEALCANNLHQADIVGPRYIKGGIRFYSFNVMDIFTHRVTVGPSKRKADHYIAKRLIRTWKTLGIPDFLQMDNELSFRGSNRHPRSLGLVLRLCLSLEIQPIFIPPSQPWRNGEIENFQKTFNKNFFRSQFFSSFKELCRKAAAFERYHNKHYIYSCLQGKTPDQVLAFDPGEIVLLSQSYRLPKDKIPIENGYIHFIRYIRSDRQLDVFGEHFTVSKDLIYEYVKATICIEIHSLQIRLDNELVQSFEYRMPIDKV